VVLRIKIYLSDRNLVISGWSEDTYRSQMSPALGVPNAFIGSGYQKKRKMNFQLCRGTSSLADQNL
jgi:hypothetical protein